MRYTRFGNDISWRMISWDVSRFEERDNPANDIMRYTRYEETIYLDEWYQGIYKIRGTIYLEEGYHEIYKIRGTIYLDEWYHEIYKLRGSKYLDEW